MEYFIRGSAHFFNLFADFLEHCENIIYFIFAIILLILIFLSFSKIKSSLNGVLKSYIGLFKFLPFSLGFVLLLISSILTYKINNHFKILSLLVTIVNFIIETINIYDNNILNKENKKIFKVSDFKTIIVSNLILIFFKITYWAELYTFDLVEKKNYFITMFLIVLLQLLVMVIFKLYSIYDKVFRFTKNKNEYNMLKKIHHLIHILAMSNNKINYFRIIKIYLQREIITKQNAIDILNFCYYYKAIDNKFKYSDIDDYNLKVYNDFKSLSNRLGSDLDE